MGRPKKVLGDFPLPKAPVVSTAKTPLIAGSLNEHAVFKWIMMQVQKQHPMWQELPFDASLTARSSHQIKCETFQQVVKTLWSLAEQTNASTLETTYGIEEPHNEK